MSMRRFTYWCLLSGLLLAAAGPWATVGKVTTTTAQQASSGKIHALMAVGLGTRTHAVTQIEMARELLKRGHTVTFSCYDDQMAWAKELHGLRFHSLGENPTIRNMSSKEIRTFLQTQDNPEKHVLPDRVIYMLFSVYEEHYRLMHALMVEQRIEVVMCDFFHVACIDAARALQIPYAISTMSIDITEYGGHPTLPVVPMGVHLTMEHASFLERLWDTVIAKPLEVWKYRDAIKFQHSVLERVGTPLYSMLETGYDEGLVIVTSVPGFETPRPTLPNVIHVNMPASPKIGSVGADIEAFLSDRSRVVLLAFGTGAMLSKHHFERLIHDVAHAYDTGAIDGVVWGLTRTTMQDLPEFVEVTGTGAATHRHIIDDMRAGRHPFIWMADHVPQRAVLHHPAIKLFVSHCGLASAHEAIEAAVPILALPIFGDQPVNAARVVAYQAGLRLRWRDVGSEAAHAALHTLMDPATRPAYVAGMTRLQRLARVYTPQLLFAADMLEAIATTPQLFALLEAPAHRMGWWRANRLDVWLFLAVLAAAVTGAAGVAGRRFWQQHWAAGKSTVKAKRQ